MSSYSLETVLFDTHLAEQEYEEISAGSSTVRPLELLCCYGTGVSLFWIFAFGHV